MICVLEGKQRIPAPEGWIMDGVPVPQSPDTDGASMPQYEAEAAGESVETGEGPAVVALGQQQIDRGV